MSEEQHFGSEFHSTVSQKHIHAFDPIQMEPFYSFGEKKTKEREDDNLPSITYIYIYIYCLIPFDAKGLALTPVLLLRIMYFINPVLVNVSVEFVYSYCKWQSFEMAEMKTYYYMYISHRIEYAIVSKAKDMEEAYNDEKKKKLQHVVIRI